MYRDQSFSPHDFKDWLSGQSDLNEFFDLSSRTAGTKPGDEMVGCEVQAKVSIKKLREKVESEDGDSELLIEDLVEDGGMVLSVDGKNLLVEVESGSFRIPRFCVRLIKPE